MTPDDDWWEHITGATEAQVAELTLVYVPVWREWEAYEGSAATRGSGATADQMTGAAMMLSWLIDRQRAILAATKATE